MINGKCNNKHNNGKNKINVFLDNNQEFFVKM